MKTPVCVLHYNNILHITVGNAIQQVGHFVSRCQARGLC